MLWDIRDRMWGWSASSSKKQDSIEVRLRCWFPLKITRMVWTLSSHSAHDCGLLQNDAEYWHSFRHVVRVVWIAAKLSGWRMTHCWNSVLTNLSCPFVNQSILLPLALNKLPFLTNCNFPPKQLKKRRGQQRRRRCISKPACEKTSACTKARPGDAKMRDACLLSYWTIH